MWEKGWRQSIWNELGQEWDIIVIGGGITGAGVLRRAAAEGLKTLLVEASDFSFGTSSRSSKLVHGGIRYLRNKQFDVTRESVHEREWMLREARNLVTPLGCLMPYYQDRKIREEFALGVVLYDLMAPKWKHARYSRQRLVRECPLLESPELGGGFLYYDAQMDDSRLVLTLIREAVRAGGIAINYAKVESLLRDSTGRVCGIGLADNAGGMPAQEIKAKVVINATGPWSDDLRSQVGAPARLRRLRGSHLIFPRDRIPLPYDVSLLHPKDDRAMFAIPWEGTTLIGTTDLDHKFDLDAGEPFATREEIDYILEAANSSFPAVHLGEEDIISSFAGLRPVINTGKADPSKESRAHVVWEEDGLITVTGGKLTTFRIMAEQALQKAAPMLRGRFDFSQRKRYFDPLPPPLSDFMLDAEEKAYLLGRYGIEASELLSSAREGENQPIKSLRNLWSELRYNARCGGVVHLDDLLLRRVRLGLLLPEGGIAEMPRIRQIVQGELGWDDRTWWDELERYRKIYRASYAPIPGGIPPALTGDFTWPQNVNAPHPGTKDERQKEPTVLYSNGAIRR